MTDRRALVGFVDCFSRTRTVVVGDLMLDRYIWGKASRISQEAPVPVVHVQKETHVPGGAANVVRNIASLGGRACAFGAVGNDAYGDRLLALLQEAGADIGGVGRCGDRITTLKTRVLAGNQQVVRIDHEDNTPLPLHMLDRLRNDFCRCLDNEKVDAVIFEDYAKGLLTRDLMHDMIKLCRDRGIPTALDPHPGHPYNVKGLTLMTPNRAEAFGLAGAYYQPTVLPIENDAALGDVGCRLQELWDVELLLVTMGGDGMALFRRDAPPVHIPTCAREVFDVSGAGDTVTASFMLALAAGAAPVQAAELANHAAGIVVGKVGTVAVQIDELRRELLNSGDACNG